MRSRLKRFGRVSGRPGNRSIAGRGERPRRDRPIASGTKLGEESSTSPSTAQPSPCSDFSSKNVQTATKFFDGMALV